MWPLVFCSRRNLSVSGFLFAFLLTLIVPRSSLAQTQQPFRFANEASNGQITGIAVFVRNDQTGELTEVTNSPFSAIHSPSCGLSVVDPKGPFAYGACGLGASMYTINATTGAVAEVPGSPFAASEDTTPGIVAAESTGQYVYVLKASFSVPYPQTSTALLDSFQIDPGGLQLIAPSSQQISLNGTLVSASVSQHGFYLLLNQNQNTGSPVAVLYAILFDPVTGQASAPQSVLETGNDAGGMLLDSPGSSLRGKTAGASGFFSFPKPTEH
jgi:hypothetical protein